MALGNQITSDCFPLANQARLGVQKKMHHFKFDDLSQHNHSSTH